MEDISIIERSSLSGSLPHPGKETTVWEACGALQNAGITPTIQSVGDKLVAMGHARGSNRDLATHIRTWRKQSSKAAKLAQQRQAPKQTIDETQAPTTAPRSSLAEAISNESSSNEDTTIKPEESPLKNGIDAAVLKQVNTVSQDLSQPSDALNDIIHQLRKTLHEEAYAKLDGVKQHADEQLKNEQRVSQTIEAKNTELLDEIKQLKSARTEAEQSLQHAQNELSGALTELSESKAELDILSDQIKSQEDNYKTLIDTLREEATQWRQTYETKAQEQEAKLQQQIYSLQDTLEQATQEKARYEKEALSLREENESLNNSHFEAQEKWKAIIDEIRATATDEINGAEASYEEQLIENNKKVHTIETQLDTVINAFEKYKNEKEGAAKQHIEEVNRLKEIIANLEQNVFQAGYKQGNLEAEIAVLRGRTTA